MAYQEASSGKNDLMTALWVALLAIQALRAGAGRGFSSAEWAALGGNLGLCWLTKGTGLIYSFPIVVLLGWRLARRGGLSWKGPVLAAAIALLLVGNHYRRNWAWFGAPLGHAVSMERDEMNRLYTPGAFASNLVRDVALQFPTPSEALNRVVQHGIEQLHRLLHQGIDDPRTSLVAPGAHYEIRYQPNYDTLTAAPLQALLALVLPFWLWGSGRGGRGSAWILLGLSAAGLCLFAAAAKWQPWGARLELPLFVLIVPVAGWLGATRDRIGWGGWMAAIGAALALLPALNIYERPLWGRPNVFTARREELEFRFWPSLGASQDAVTAVLGDPRIHCVRFAMDQMNWSYPMMRRLLDQRSEPPVFWGPQGSPAPDAVVDYPGPDGLPLEIRQPGSPERYLAVGNAAPYGVYLREGLLRADPAASSYGLPHFIGWSASSGLTAVTIGTAQGPIEGRVAAGSEIQLSGPFAGPGSVLRAEVRVLREPLSFLVESGHHSLAEVVVAQGETRRIEVRVGVANEIVLRPVGRSWGDRNLIFLRLQVLDPSVLPAALRAAR